MTRPDHDGQQAGGEPGKCQWCKRPFLGSAATDEAHLHCADAWAEGIKTAMQYLDACDWSQDAVSWASEFSGRLKSLLRPLPPPKESEKQ